MLDKCKRSCNLCGDLVSQKDRIQPTSKNYRSRRPSTVFNPNVEFNTNIPWNRFMGYVTEQIPTDESSVNNYSERVNDWKSTTKETIKNTPIKRKL